MHREKHDNNFINIWNISLDQLKNILNLDKIISMNKSDNGSF